MVITVAVSVIAACSIIRIIQNGIQLHQMIRDTDARNKTYREVIKSAGRTEKQIIREFLEEAEEHMKKNKKRRKKMSFNPEELGIEIRYPFPGLIVTWPF